MLCRCHEEPMRPHGDGFFRCAVKARANQARYARRCRAGSVEYRVTQRLGRLRRERGRVMEQLAQLQEGNCGAQS